MVAAAGPRTGAAAIPQPVLSAVSIVLAAYVRRATLADVAAIARLSVPAGEEARRTLPSLADPEPVSAPEIALRLLDELDDGSILYVAEADAPPVGFAQVGPLMVGEGGHLVDLTRLYVSPQRRRAGVGRLLLALVLRELAERSVPAGLRTWASGGSVTSAFLLAAGMAPLQQRWRVGRGGVAVPGVVYGWAAKSKEPRGRPAAALRPSSSAATS